MMGYFGDSISSSCEEIRECLKRPRQTIQHILHVVGVVMLALMVWRSLILITNCATPVVVVLSGSMEPSYHRGDILLLSDSTTYSAGDVLVFELKDRNIPIVHRTLSIYGDQKELKVLTKGDNNNVDDRGLYPRGQNWLTDSNLIGSTRAFVPVLGMLTIWINEVPGVKYSVGAIMGVLLLMGYD